MSRYEQDFYAWALEQSELAKRRSANELDWDNVAEELDGLSKQTRAELLSHYVVLLLHLLKWRHQPTRRGASWEATIKVQRMDIEDHLVENPSLKSNDAEIYARAYRRARVKAVQATRLSERTFPADSPFTVEQARDPEFWPDAVD